MNTRFFKEFCRTKFGLLASIFPTAAVLYQVNSKEEKRSSFNGSQNVFLASNSLIHGIDGLSTESMTGIPPIVVLSPVWLEKVDKSHYHHKWGQTPLGLPAYPRQLFHRLYPNHPNDNYVTWKQMLEVRQLQIENLKRLHEKGQIVLHDIRSADIGKYDRGELFRLDHKDKYYIFYSNGTEVFKIPEDHLGMVHNFLSRPLETSPAQVQIGLITRPHTELYYLSPDKVPKTLLIAGTGLSTVWIRKHFPMVKNLFVLARRKNAEMPKIPSNEEVDYDAIKLITHDDLLISEEQGLLAVEDQSLKTRIEIDPSTCFFSAIGYKPYTELTACIPDNHKLTLADSQKLIWTAPKNIPPGSLTQRLMIFYYLSELYTDYNYVYEMQYYLEKVTPIQLQRKLIDKNIELNLDFFDHLGKVINDLDNPVDKQQELYLYMKVFAMQEPSLEEQERFKYVIKEMQKEIEQRPLLLESDEDKNIADNQDPKTYCL